MNRFRLLIATLLAAGMAGAADIAPVISSDAQGWLMRGELLYGNHIYSATLDQLTHMSQLSPDRMQKEDAHYFSALASLHSGDDEALQLLRSFLTRYPQSPCSVLAQTAVGDYYFSRSDYKSALAAYEKVASKTLDADGRADLLFRKAYCNLLLGRNNAARTLFAGLSADKRYGNAARFYTGYIEFAERNYPKALEIFGTVDRSVQPGNTVAAYVAQILFARSDYEGALKNACEVLADPGLAAFATESQRIAGESLYDLGRHDQAMPYLWQYAAASSNPEPSALYMLGTAEYDAGHYHEAIGLLQKAVGEPSETTQSACLYLGQAYSRTGNKNAALMAFENAYRMNINDAVTEAAFYNFVVVKLDGARTPFSDNVGLLDTFLKRFPHSPYAAKIGEYMADGYMAENNYAAALDVVKRIPQTSAHLRELSQRASFMLGTQELTDGNASRALALFDSAAEGPDASVALQSRLWRAEALEALGRYAEATSGYTYFINHSQRGAANLPVARYGLAYALFQNEKYGEAQREFAEYLKVAPGASPELRSDASCRIGDCLYYTGHIAEAERNYKTACDIMPDKADYALYQTAIMKGLRRDHASKISIIDNLIANFPTSPLVPDALLAKAESQTATGKSAEAAATYSDVARRFPSTAQGRSALLRLAIAHSAAGKKADAVAAYKKVISTYPSSEEARLAIDDLKRLYADDGRLDEFSRYLATVPNAPQITPAEYDAAAFTAAEKEYLNRQTTGKLEEYLRDYPSGAYEAKALLYMAQAAVQAGKPARVLEYTTELAARYPDTESAEDVLFMKAEAETDLNRIEPALATYTILERRASTAGNQLEARLGVMRSALLLHRADEALAAANRIIDAGGVSETVLAEAYCGKGNALEMRGSHADAEKAWQQAINIGNGSLAAAQSAVELAQSRLSRNKLDSAKKGIEEFINSNPRQQYWLARGFIVLSDILRRQNNTFEADEYLRTLRKNYPGKEADIFQMIDERLSNN